MDKTNKSSPPEVSIITANYNCERFIESTIQSVLKQTFTDWEMIIVDDCSTDQGPKIIEKYCQADSRIKLVSLVKNSGPAVARNKAIEQAKGRFIAFLDSDDLWTEDKLEVQISFMKKNNFSLTYTEYVKVNEDGKVISDVIQRPEKVNYQKMLNSNFIPCLTAIYDSALLGKVYMPLILKRQDYGLWFKILKVTDYAYAINQPLAYYRVRKNDSVSSNKFKSAIYHWKILREVENVPLIKAIYHFMQYALIGYIKFLK